MAKQKDVLERVMGRIQRVRQPGDPPRERLDSFDDFECDLCKGFVTRREMTQCHYCGRWVCRDQCWDREALSCISCASVIKLAKELGSDGEVSDRREDGARGGRRVPVLDRLRKGKGGQG